MIKRKIYITEKDKVKLRNLFGKTLGMSNNDLKSMKELLEEIERAEVMTDENIDETVITMNSTFVVEDINTHKEYDYTIVYPEFADSSKNKISILAPVGTALLGYKVGDIVEWSVPAGKRKFRIKEMLYQPEAAVKSLNKVK
ncbi:MAG: nucleoside diphosphate kinase regulator [Ignavibacteriota bacterium]|jgi:regulator of nucleoside diphosphate kinase|nr:nucleoside diphosphate kinase regulator [Ignavibacteriales bacterium]MBL1122308.1 nucleoside diphosphate kinase regulator [Ignavibacteriota bacterium]MBV6421276.1 Regulator of nucleoside diphosphate kinase [Ignavibacteriaceae bacterium]MCE7854942.1 nucleoside diphosphate kinase regulator [Ignavibacteria bacterium CHB3]MEB2296230.1 nucleoside diphosphate kinase regulator [Ignavibacteria bacterium]